MQIAMPAQGQKSWDQSLMTSGGRTLMVAMPAQGQKSWDEVSCCDFLAASVVAMSAQGQKSWDFELYEHNSHAAKKAKIDFAAFASSLA